jgi:hypothetical protein
MLSSALCFGCWNARSKCVDCESDANYATTPEDTGGGSSTDDSPSKSADESSSALNRGRYFLALMQTSTDTSMDQNHNADVVDDIQVSQQLSGPLPTASDHQQEEDEEVTPPPLVEIGDELRSVHQDIPFTDNMGQKVESMPRIPCDSPVVDCPTTITYGTYCKFS